jgi:hypothetical protein
MLACYKCDYMLPDQDGEAYCQCGAKMFQSEPWAVEPQKRLQMIADGIGYEVWAAMDRCGFWCLYDEKPECNGRNRWDLTNYDSDRSLAMDWEHECPDWKESLLYAEPGGAK